MLLRFFFLLKPTAPTWTNQPSLSKKRSLHRRKDEDEIFLSESLSLCHNPITEALPVRWAFITRLKRSAATSTQAIAKVWLIAAHRFSRAHTFEVYGLSSKETGLKPHFCRQGSRQKPDPTSRPRASLQVWGLRGLVSTTSSYCCPLFKTRRRLDRYGGSFPPLKAPVTSESGLVLRWGS